MSNYVGDRFCPECGQQEWVIQDWDTYHSVVCGNCGHKVGELPGGLLPARTHGKPAEVTRPALSESALPKSTVIRADLEYLLAHYWDEVKGRPDRSHWRLPMLEQAALRLSEAVRES